MDIVIIGIAALVLWLVSLVLYFRSSRQQADIHREIEALNERLDASDGE